jgi:hypothetical protein
MGRRKNRRKVLVVACIVGASNLGSLARGDSATPGVGNRPQNCVAQATAWKPPTSMEWVSNSRGLPEDVIGMYVHGSLESMVSAFEKAGWTKAMPRNLATDTLYVVGTILDSASVLISRTVFEAEKLLKKIFHHPKKLKRLPDPLKGIVQRMPVSPESLCGKASVLAMEMNNNPVGGRDHFRVYSMPEKDEEGRPVWALAASRDIRIKFDPHGVTSFFMTHVPQSDEDFERDFVLGSLQALNVIQKTDVIQLEPTGIAPANGAYSKDGRVYDVVLSPSDTVQK